MESDPRPNQDFHECKDFFLYIEKKRGYNRPFYAQGVFPNFKVLGFTFYTLASFVVKNRTRSRQSDLEAMIRCETITARPNGFLTWQTGPVQTYYATAAGGSYDADA